MAALPASSARPPRLNPFAFPSDTDFRFILLVVAVLAVSMFMYGQVFVTANRDEYRRVVLACARQFPTTTTSQTNVPIGSLLSMPTQIADELGARAAASNACLAPLVQKQNAWKLGGIALLLLVAALIYWFFPVWKMRREHFEPLTAEDAPAVLPALHALCQQTGVKPIPQFVWNPLNPAVSALAFGRLGRYTVALSGGLIIQFAKDRAAFDATLRHELAHLRNADVDKTYLTVAITWAFVIAAIVPLVVTLLMSFEPGFVIGITWRVAALIALVYLIRNAFLRAREMYADVRASTWDGTNGALDRVVSGLAPTPTGRWRSLWLTHPTPAQRRQALADTRILLRLGFWDAFAVGVVTAIGIGDVLDVFESVNITQSDMLLIAYALVFTPLIIGVVGLAAWRATFARVVEQQRLPSVKSWAVGLGLGLALGHFLALRSAVFTQSMVGSDLGGQLAQAAFTVGWGALMIVGLLVFLRWLVACAADWLHVTLEDAPPRRVYVVGLLLAAVVLALGVGLFYMTVDAADLSGATMGLTWIGIWIAYFFWDLFRLAPTALLAALWAYPLASAFWRQRAVPTPTSWAFLDPAPAPKLPTEESIRVRRILLHALVLALVYAALAAGIRLLARWALPESVRASDDYLLALAGVLYIMAAVLQAGFAFYVAARARRQPVAQAMFAAFAAGLMMAVASLAVNKLWGGGLDPDFVRDYVCFTVNVGALLSLPLALIANAAAHPKPAVA